MGEKLGTLATQPPGKSKIFWLDRHALAKVGITARFVSSNSETR